MPASLQFEPMKLCGPSVTCLPAGASLPETSISVLNGCKGKVSKALIAGRRHHLEVVSDGYSPKLAPATHAACLLPSLLNCFWCFLWTF
jgi:hypothetical protein